MDRWEPGVVAFAPWLLRPDAFWGFAAGTGCLLAIGWLCLPRLSSHSWSHRWLLRSVAGCIAVPVLVLLAGQFVGLLFRIPWRSIGGAGWALLVVSAAVEIHSRRSRGPRSVTLPPHAGRVSPQVRAARITRLVAVAGWILVAHWHLQMLWPALSPPLAYDVLEYHLAVVPQAFAAGEVKPIEGVVYTRQPLATEMLFLLSAIAEGWARGAGPGLIHWAVFVLSTLLYACLARRLRIPLPARPWLWLAVLAHPLVFKLQLDNFTDWTGGLMLLGGLLILSRGRTRKRWAFFVGACAGGAVAAKWTNVGTVAIPLLLALLLGPRPIGARRRWVQPLDFLVGAGVVLAPWVGWLALEVRNPFSPFLAGVFPTDIWPAERLDFLIGTHGPLRPISTDYWLNLVSRLAVGLDGWPLMAAALVLSAGTALLIQTGSPRGRFRRPVRLMYALLAGAICALLLWGQLRHGADRFLAPVMILCALSLGLSLRLVSLKLDAIRASGLTVAMAAGLAALALWPVRDQLRAIQYLGMPGVALGTLSPAEFIRRGLGETAALFEAANRLPADARIIAINEARGYYCRRPVALASVFDRSPIRAAVAGADDPDSIRARLTDAGYTHLLVNEQEQSRLLIMHPPPRLAGDPRRMELAARGDNAARAALAREFPAEVEFAADPLTPNEREAYLRFLNGMRGRATWINAPAGGYPAMWIADLRTGAS